MAGQTFSVALSAGRRAARFGHNHRENLIIAGWTGRDTCRRRTPHQELEAIGVKRPASVPIFYRVSAARLTTASSIQVLGERSSGEVEFALLQWQGQLWVGAGSDHTDREAETYGVSLSKQMCDKPVGARVLGFRRCCRRIGTG